MLVVINQNEPKLIFKQEEFQNEGAIYKGKGKKTIYCIFSDAQPNRNFDKDPYIKVYNNSEQKKATEVLRISMKDGRPIYHRNRDKDAGKKDMKYTKELAQFLTDSMDKPHCADISDKNIVTVYDAIYYFISLYYSNYIKYPIPDFMEAYKK